MTVRVTLKRLQSAIARGSARSACSVELYELLAAQSHLLTKFGGHPFAAGLNLPSRNLELFEQALNQAMRSRQASSTSAPAFDLIVSVQELGQSLFKELQLLEPYGIGNPVPRLLIKDCWFEDVAHRNLRDRTRRKLKYIQAVFSLRDQSSASGFPGIWWEHYKDDVPQGRCNVIAELEFNNYQRRPELGVLEVSSAGSYLETAEDEIEILDYRNRMLAEVPTGALVVDHCPQSWDEWGRWVQRSRQSQRPLILAYGAQEEMDADATWQRLVGITKAAMRSGDAVSWAELQAVLRLSEQVIGLGLDLLGECGALVIADDSGLLYFSGRLSTSESLARKVQDFCRAIEEERFQQRYFSQISIELIQSGSASTLLNHPAT
ncbi:MAG: DHHA1 domain-containing protein [Cyanobacteria bacterium P01_F01_bin.42]